MSQSSQSKSIKFETPVFCRIRVQGHLDETWSDHLGGLSITTGVNEGVQVTTLSGCVTDQAALVGILNTIYDLRFPLLLLECLDAEKNADSSD